MRTLHRILISLFAILIVAIEVLPATALAAAPPAPAAPTPQSTANNGQALEIAPPVIYLSANPGQNIKTQIFLRNISKGNLIVSGQANDFVAAGEDGTPKLLVNNDQPDPYSLKAWVAPPTNLLLVPKEIKTMAITINIPANASPGGHYGVIRFTATPPELQGTGVSLSASLGALILLTVNGNIKEQLSVKEFSVNHNGKTASLFQSGPLNFLERFSNTGNIHEQPTGQVVITDMFGRKFAAVNVNSPPKSILPQSIRRFEEPLDSTVIGNKKMFGRYHANLKVTYGTNKQQLASTITFWVIPYKLVAIVIIVLIAAFFLIRFGLRRYNRYILNRANKGRK